MVPVCLHSRGNERRKKKRNNVDETNSNDCLLINWVAMWCAHLVSSVNARVSWHLFVDKNRSLGSTFCCDLSLMRCSVYSLSCVICDDKNMTTWKEKCELKQTLKNCVGVIIGWKKDERSEENKGDNKTAARVKYILGGVKQKTGKGNQGKIN